jgi:serine phosphatase RsbU (regulator of sigma subunit)
MKTRKRQDSNGFCTGAELSRKVGVKPCTITKLTKLGVLKRNADMMYHAAESLAAWEQHERTKQQGQKSAHQAASLRDELTVEKIRKARVEADQAEAAVIPVADVVAAVSRAFYQLKSKWAKHDKELAPVIVGMGTPAEIEKEMDAKRTVALDGLAQEIGQWISK